MAALRLIDALPDFSAPTPQMPAPRAASHADRAPPPAPAPQQPDISEIVRMEVAVAEEAMRLRLDGEHRATLEAEREAHAEALAMQAERLGTDAGHMIIDRLDVLERRLADQLSANLARVVGGVLSEELQRRSVEALAKTITDALGDAEAIRIEVRGPQSMFAGLSTALGDRIVNIHYLESGSLDLSATIDGTVFETRLSQWAEILAGVLE